MARNLRRGTPLHGSVGSQEIKKRAIELGADLCGIASAATLNAFPPDPRWPQTPERISPYCKSVIVIVQRIPAGAFRCKTNVPVQYLDMLVLRRVGVQVRGIGLDPMIGDYLLDAGARTHGMDHLAQKYLKHRMIPISDLIGTG